MENFKKDLLYWAKRLYQKNMSPATSGNISVRTSKGVLISASNVCLNDMAEDDLILIDFDGNTLCKNAKKPSSEKFLHTQIYEMRDDINAIIHSHCPLITAFAVAHQPMRAPIMPEFVFNFDNIPLAEYETPSSIKLAAKTSKFFTSHNIVLMANHGVVCGGAELKECFYNLEALRAYAETYFAANILGKPKLLNKAQIEDIRKLKG
ncbi:L-fuculose-phosphate aldolase [Candidatus Gastranaerophilus sp. (ex Termes propinquus)]|nr:L-fuculose-phosphate aldolase [Candidatus Gastranaerophilus sp. (ex Termes propinquus)]